MKCIMIAAGLAVSYTVDVALSLWYGEPLPKWRESPQQEGGEA